jgi:hypothetical protein
MTERKEPRKNVPGIPFKPGNPGRPKGTPNKFTTLKQAFLDAFNELGGADGLITWAQESKRNREVFYQMITKLFPQEVAHSGAIKTGDKLIMHVVHTRPEGNGKGNGSDGNGQEKAK